MNFYESIDKSGVMVYHESDSTQNGGDEVQVREAINAAVKASGLTLTEVAGRLGWTKQQLNGRLARESIRADEFFKLLDAVGVDLVMIKRDTNEEIKAHTKGVGRRVRATFNGVIYDTDKADAIANNFYADGVNEYNDGKAMELYIDGEGRYFIAEYSDFEGVRDYIFGVTAKDAAQFIEKFGSKK